MDSLRGRLLVASPALVDPNFRRTVVLVGEHTSEEGAMGLVLNRPSESAVADAAPHLAPLVADGDVVHVGGPVDPSAVLVLAEFERPDEAATIVFGDVGFMSSQSDLDDVVLTTTRARVYVGYAGWSPGQLEAELDEESWIVLEPEAADVFSDAADDVWGRVLHRQGGQLRLLARMPFDPTLN